MIRRITMTAAAYEAIKGKLTPDEASFPPLCDPEGGPYLVAVDEKRDDALWAQRRLGETYSDVILRLAEMEAARSS
jgi:hypothetical protein